MPYGRIPRRLFVADKVGACPWTQLLIRMLSAAGLSELCLLLEGATSLVRLKSYVDADKYMNE